MADPLSAIGAASAIVQLIGGVSSGLRTLRDAVVSIKDAPRTVQRLEEKIQQLGHCFSMLEKYFQSRPSKIPYETQLYELIQEIAASCTAPLKILKEKTPTHLSKKNVAAAFDLWLNNSAISQAKTQINESIPYLNLLLQTLNLLKADQTDDLLRQIAASLNQTARPQHPLPNQNAAVYEFSSHSLETTLRGIRTFANDATAYIVQSESVSTTTATSSRFLSIGTLRPGDINPVSSTVQSPTFPKAKRQLDHEWEQNRKDLERLVGYGLYENAEKIQRRALLIKEEFSNHHGVPFTREERDEMEEQLADILIECKTEGSKEKAVSLIEEILGHDSRDKQSDNNLLTLPLSPKSDEKRLSLHYKLGRLYKSTGQMDLAEMELRIAFNAYAEDSLHDMAKVREAGEQLLELYDIRVEFGDREHRPVFLSQLHGFKQELQTVMGRPLDHQQTTCDKALDWCEKEGIVVSREDDGPRFDILDENGSSPLHHAAEKCEDEVALQQMMENSDTLENRDSSGDTPLLVAVGSSNTTALAVLLQKGASVKARDSQQQTPLHRSQKPSVTKFLLHHRLRRASLFDEARRFSSSSDSSFTAFTSSSIADHGLDIDAQDAHKKTALYLACSQGRDKIVRLLLLAGADPNIAAHDSTPLTITIESQARSYMRDPKKKVDIVAALVSRGADPEAGKRVLRSPRGVQKEIQKALEGRVGAQLLQPQVSANWTIKSSEDSAYQPSLSSDTSKPHIEQLDFGPALLLSSDFGGLDKPDHPPAQELPNLTRHPPGPRPSTAEQQHQPKESSPNTSFSETFSDSYFSEESVVDHTTEDMPRRECDDSDIANIHRSRRFGDPERWQRRLDTLGSDVFRDSSINGYIHTPSPSLLFTRVDDYTLDAFVFADVKSFDNTIDRERFRLRLMAEGILKNIQNIKDAEYCGDFLSILIAETSRKNVATLQSILLSDIVSVTSTIYDALSNPDFSNHRLAADRCEVFLNGLLRGPDGAFKFFKQIGYRLGEVITTKLSKLQREDRSEKLRCALLISSLHTVLSILDLAILSYCGAHLEQLHSDFPRISETPRLLLAPGLSLARKKLRCLDKLLQGPVWVFEVEETAGKEPESGDLWLSTTVEAFADIWGPVWPVAEPKQPHEVARFDVGRGSIVGWKRAPDEPDPEDNEVFCHWVSASEPRPPELYVGGELLNRKLLIGGRLAINEECTMRTEDFTAEMQDKNRLSDLGVGQRRWYTDARTLAWQLGGLGITAGAQETYKRRNESYRDTLCTALQKDDFDSTLCVLRRRYVVEISACTGLARRQSILYALSSVGFENYLKKSEMGWDEEERSQYFEMLRSSLEQNSLGLIRDRLSKPHFGDLIKKALKKSFCNVLLTTGRPDDAELAAFWGFERDETDDLGFLVSYPTWDNSWTGLLREGSLGFNAAMVSPICLELHKRKHPTESLECAKTCPNSNRYTLLETLLFVNNRELSNLPRGLELVDIENSRSYFAKRWSVRDIKAGGVFHLGEQGRLTILKRMGWLDGGAKRSGLIVEWTDPRPSRFREATHEIRQKIGRAEPPCHREHLGPERGDPNGPAPIVTHIVSHASLATGE